MLVCAFTNIGAVARSLMQAESVAILCAGREDRFSIDDALCAGTLVARLREELDDPPQLDDAARAAAALADSLHPDRAFLAQTAAGRALADIGLAEDLEICAHVDRHGIVPEMRDQAIMVQGS